jgi:hypothetical protein
MACNLTANHPIAPASPTRPAPAPKTLRHRRQARRAAAAPFPQPPARCSMQPCATFSWPPPCCLRAPQPRRT